MNIHHNLEAIKDLAIESAKDHGCNYNVIMVDPDENGTFAITGGSTYEFVTDSYFEKPRPNAIILYKTDDLIAEKPFCLLWDLERKEYARVESPWSDKDLKSVARFEVRERFKTEEELIDALKKAKIIDEENKKSVGKMGIIGAGNFARTIMHGDTPGPVVIVDSNPDALGVDPFGTSTPIFNPYNNSPEIINIDTDVFPMKRKGKTNYTAPKKKRKK